MPEQNIAMFVLVVGDEMCRRVLERDIRGMMETLTTEKETNKHWVP